MTTSTFGAGAEQAGWSTHVSQDAPLELSSTSSMGLGQRQLSVQPSTIDADSDQNTYLHRTVSAPADLSLHFACGTMPSPCNQHPLLGAMAVEDASSHGASVLPVPMSVNATTITAASIPYSTPGANPPTQTGATPTFGNTVPPPVFPRNVTQTQETVAPPSPPTVAARARAPAKTVGRFKMEQAPTSPLMQTGKNDVAGLLPPVPPLTADSERTSGVPCEGVRNTQKIGRFTVKETTSPGGLADDDFTDSTTPDSASMCTDRPEGSSVGSNMSEIIALGRQFSVLFDNLVSAMRNLPSGSLPLRSPTMPGAAQGVSVPQSVPVLQMLQNQQAFSAPAPVKKSANGGSSSSTAGKWGKSIPHEGAGTSGTAINDEDGAINMWKNLGKPIELATKRNRQLEEEHTRLKTRLAEKRQELEALQAQWKQVEQRSHVPAVHVHVPAVQSSALIAGELPVAHPVNSVADLSSLVSSSVQGSQADMEEDLTDTVQDSSEFLTTNTLRKGRFGFKLARTNSLPDLLDVAMDQQLQAMSQHPAKGDNGCSPEVKGYGTPEQYQHTRQYHHHRLQEQMPRNWSPVEVRRNWRRSSNTSD